MAGLFGVFGVRDLAAAFARLRPGLLGLYLLAGLVVRLGLSLRWFLVARRMGETPPLSRFFAARLAGDAVSSLVPAGSVGGDPLRIALLYGRGVGGVRAGAGVALDRLMEVIANILCGVGYVAVFSASHVMPDAASLTFGAAAAPMGLLIALLAVPIVMLWRGIRPLTWMVRESWLRRRPRWQPWVDLVRRTEDELGATFRQRPRMVLAGIAGSLLVEAAVVAEYGCLLAAFGVEVDLPTLLMVLVTVGLVRAVPMPAGIGTLEGGQVTLMAAAQGRADLGFLVGVILRLHETLWAATGLLVLSQQGLSITRPRPPDRAEAREPGTLFERNDDP